MSSLEFSSREGLLKNSLNCKKQAVCHVCLLPFLLGKAHIWFTFFLCWRVSYGWSLNQWKWSSSNKVSRVAETCKLYIFEQNPSHFSRRVKHRGENFCSFSSALQDAPLALFDTPAAGLNKVPSGSGIITQHCRTIEWKHKILHPSFCSRVNSKQIGVCKMIVQRKSGMLGAVCSQ